MAGRKATTGSSFGLNAEQVMVAQAMAAGNNEDEVLRIFWQINDKSTPQERQKARRELHKWMDMPGYIECYQSEVKRLYTPIYSKALAKIAEQIDSKLPWLANKAANDVLTRIGAMMGDNDNTVHVQIEGMPELGTPDQDE